MKTLILYASFHHGNTEKVARVIADTLETARVRVDRAQPEALSPYDLIGFGSGVYRGMFEGELIKFVGALPPFGGRRAFIFSTSATGDTHEHGEFEQLLVNRGFVVIGNFACLGWMTAGLSKLVGGINKGRPNDDDLDEAQMFAVGLKEKYAASERRQLKPML